MWQNPDQLWLLVKAKQQDLETELKHNTVEARAINWWSQMEFWLGGYMQRIGEALQRHSQLQREPEVCSE